MCVSACRCTYVGTCLELRNYTSHTEAPLDEGVACFFGPSRMRGAPLCLMGRRSTIRMRPANLSMLSGSFFFGSAAKAAGLTPCFSVLLQSRHGRLFFLVLPRMLEWSSPGEAVKYALVVHPSETKNMRRCIYIYCICTETRVYSQCQQQVFLTFSKFKVVLNGMHGLSTSQEKNVRKQLFAHFPIHLLSSAPESHTRTATEMESQGEFIGYIVFGSLRTFGQV